jgi:hypothetical protein
MRKLQLLAGIAVSALALFIVLRDVEWSEVLDRIQEANHGLLALAALMLLGTLVIRALRWRVILRVATPPRLWHLFGSVNVAFFLNNLLPLQVGDVGRGYLLSEIAGVSLTRTLSTILVERVLDVLTLLVILLALALFIDIPPEVRAPSIVLAVVFSGIGIAIVVTSRRRSLALSLVERLLRLTPHAARPKLGAMAESALEGFGALADLRTAPGLALFSVAIWLGTGLVVYIVIEAFDLPVGYDAALFLVVATTFGFFVPSTPGSVGVYHAIVTAVLVNVWDIDKETAVSFALIVHLVFYLPPMALGPLFLWLERDLWQRASFLDKLRQLRGTPIAEAQ